MKLRNNLNLIFKSFTNSYSQIFFADNYFFALILLAVSFIDFYAGVAGVVSVVITNGIAFWLGFDKNRIANGLYGFNSLLVGLGLGIHFAPSSVFYVVLVLSAILTLLLSITTSGILGKYGLPNLSLPFVLAIWAAVLATRQFHSLGLSERWIYDLNEMYALGGKRLVEIYQWWGELVIPKSIRIYFYSLGAIVFQYNLISGILIAFALLCFSRISFLLSFLGFYSAYYFYIAIGADISEAGYSYIGFNYILTAIALGGYFLIPGVKSFLWVVLLTPVVAIITISVSSILQVYMLPAFSLPFNLIVIMFLYTLKLRNKYDGALSEVAYQQNKPERNLYSFLSYKLRFKKAGAINIQLPFYGEWVVTQGHNGEHTHRSDWKHAWDFEIADQENKTFSERGLYVENYYCYGKNVLAPADGIIEEIADGIDDNIIGEKNEKENWGNTIIIKHSSFLYSKLCHLKRNSILVKKGQYIKQGEILAQVGNSGYSPYPHLHFQLQSTPYIGSKTIEYPIHSFIKKAKNGVVYKQNDIPAKNDCVSNIQPVTSMSNAFSIVSGKRYYIKDVRDAKNPYFTWEAFVDFSGKSYLYCDRTNSIAYFRSTERTLVFEHFTGNKKSALYYFYLAAYNMQNGLNIGLTITDTFPINQFKHRSPLFLLQDLIAPFFIFVKASYNANVYHIQSDFTKSDIKVAASAIVSVFGKKLKSIYFNLEINENGLQNIKIQDGRKRIELLCLNELP